MERIYNIAESFSATPGARYRTDGKFSGEEFYSTVLKDLFADCLKSGDILKIILDGSHGYATSFLDETFGRLSRDFGVSEVTSNLKFVSLEEPYLVDEIFEYIRNSSKK